LEPAAQPPRAVWRWLERIAAVIVAIGLFYGCLWLYTQHNDFTLGYHADEWTKAEQLLSERRNFNHPLLMLEATEWALKRWPAGENPQAIVETGRWVSAAMGAGAAVALAWVGYASGGLLGMLIVG